MKIDAKLPGMMPSERPEAESLRRVDPETDKKIRQVAQNFESLFVNQMVGAMRKTVAKGGMVPESNAERMYQAMLDQEYSQKISESEQIGLSKLIYEHLLRSANGR